MFSSLRARLWLSYALVIATALGVVTIVLLVFLLRNPALYRQAVLKLEAAQGVLSRTPVSGGQIESVAQEFGVRAMIFAADGTPIADTGSPLDGLKLPATALSPRGVSNVRDQAGRLWVYTVSRRSDGTWLLVAAPRPGLASVLTILTDELVRPLLQGGLIALLLALVLAYALARWIADPLQRLIKAAGEFPSRGSGKGTKVPPFRTSVEAIPEQGPYEIRVLTKAFNGMVARVEASQRSQRDLVANVSHELKTPLTSIQGFSQALIEGAADTPESRERAAEIIHDEAGRMHRLVIQLLDLAKMDAGTVEMATSAVDICALLGAVVEKLRPAAQAAGIEIVMDCPSDLPRLPGDADRLAQVFTNLLENAVKFTPAHGRITTGAALEGGDIRFSVTDTGIGISSVDLPRIFDRFYQADAAREGGEGRGSGLGLAIAQEIVEAHGGRISVRSTPGLGTEFKVYLPVHAEIGKG